MVSDGIIISSNYRNYGTMIPEGFVLRKGYITPQYATSPRAFLAELELKRRSKTDTRPIEHTGAICSEEGTCYYP